MQKTILITGATDGIGLATAKALVEQGHHVLLHGRNVAKLTDLQNRFSTFAGAGSVTSYLADLSNLSDVEPLAQAVTKDRSQLDVLINNAGIHKSSDPITADGPP
jgi:short-subunit dehydrogenase